MTSLPTLESLPGDVLRHLLTFLPPPSLSRLYRLSKAFRTLTTPALTLHLSVPFTVREVLPRLYRGELSLPISFRVSNPTDMRVGFDVIVHRDVHPDAEPYRTARSVIPREAIALLYEHEAADHWIVTPYPASVHSLYQYRPSYRSLDRSLPTRLAVHSLSSTAPSLFSPFPLSTPLPDDILSSSDPVSVDHYVSPASIDNSQLLYEVSIDLLRLRTAVDYLTAVPTPGDGPTVELGHPGETDRSIRSSTASVTRHLNEQLARLRALYHRLLTLS
jgi:hypothetical protein